MQPTDLEKMVERKLKREKELNPLRKKEPNRVRNKTIKLRATEEEKEKILAGMRSAGHGTLNNYILEMVLTGRVVHIDFDGLKESLAPLGSYAQELNKIGGNINQIAKHMNEAGINQQQVNFFVEEFAKMKQNYDQAQGELIKELNKLRKL